MRTVLRKDIPYEIALCGKTLPLFEKWSWSFNDARDMYLSRSSRQNGKKVKIYFHREFTGCSPGNVVDHIDGNRFNNCGDNYRIVTRAENTRLSNFRRGKEKWPVSQKRSSVPNSRGALLYAGRGMHLDTVASCEWLGLDGFWLRAETWLDDNGQIQASSYRRVRGNWIGYSNPELAMTKRDILKGAPDE